MIRFSMLLLISLLCGSAAAVDQQPPSTYADVVSTVQPRMVKIFGSGGLRSLESYQSGFLIAADGLILTAWSYVLDTDEATVVLDDGRRFDGKLLAADPRTELALLKIDADGLQFFDLERAVELRGGTRVLAFSNLYGVATGDEPFSVQHGIVAGRSKLDARRGTFQTPYRGEIYVLDAMSNNAGAAGGALTDSRGRLAGILGKELRDARTDIWLNYAVPIASIRDVVAALQSGKPPAAIPEEQLPDEPADLVQIGVLLIPNILRNTPPFVDGIRPNSPAAKEDIQPDDLIVLLNGQTVGTQAALFDALRRIDSVDPVQLTVLRQGDLIDLTLEPIIAASSED